MRRKLLFIPLLVLSTLLVTIQHNAKSIRAAVTTKTQIPVLTVNINKASADEIAETLTGIGLSKAKLIVAYRKSNGNFTKVEQLMDIKGIGPATIEKNRDKVTF